MSHQSTHSHDVRAKDRERKAIAEQLERWMADGNIPQLLPTQPDKSK